MPTETVTLDARGKKQWRTWLVRHHRSSPGVWLVFYKDHTGVRSISYEHSVREALCFGWVDSLIKRLDNDRYARKFTPRKPTSKWSDNNRKRWAELQAAGLLTAAGQAAAPTDNRYGSRRAVPTLPVYIAEALKKSPKAWASFQELAPTDRRRFVTWIHMAKRPETRQNHIHQSIALLEAKQRLGLK